MIFKGWPAGRKLVTGTRYRVDNPKIIEMQIGKPGLRAAAKESARFGIYLVVAVDVADYLLQDNATLGHLLGSLTVDIPSVVLASAIWAAAGSFAAGSSLELVAFVGAFACGPLLVAFGVGLVAAFGLYMLDDQLGLTDKVSVAYDKGLAKLVQLHAELGAFADQRFRMLANSQAVHDLSRDVTDLAGRLGRDRDWVRGELVRLW